MRNMKSKFEIPVHDIDRANEFYTTIFSDTLIRITQIKNHICLFPMEGINITQSMNCCNEKITLQNGDLIYLYYVGRMNNVLKKIADTGGEVIVKKTFVDSEIGYYAVFIDTEKNRVVINSLE